MILESFHATGRLCIDQTTHWMLYGHCTDVASSFLVYKRFFLQRNLFLKSIIWYSKVWLFFTDSVIIIRATLRAFWWWKQKPSQFEIHIWHCFYSCIRKDGADISLTKPFAPRFFFGTCVKVPTQIVERSLYFWYLLFSSNGMASIQKAKGDICIVWLWEFWHSTHNFLSFWTCLFVFKTANNCIYKAGFFAKQHRLSK